MANSHAQYVNKIMELARSSDDRVSSAFIAVERSHFFLPGPWHVYQFSGIPPYFSYRLTKSADPEHLYDDIAVALDVDKNINTGLPSVWVRYLTALALQPNEHALHIGCGSGYYSAVMAELVGASGQVVAYEIHERLAKQAASNLEPWPQVSVSAADGTAREYGSFDAIVVSACTTDIPRWWLASLKPGGRLLVTLGFSEYDADVGISLGMSVLIVRSEDESFTAEVVSFPYMVDCVGAQSESARMVLSDAVDRGGWDDITELRLDEHCPSASCWAHTETWCLSSRNRVGNRSQFEHYHPV